MSLARIISARREDVVSLERELRNHGFVTEIVAPGEECTHPADVEVTVEALPAETARQHLEKLQSFEGEVLVARGVAERLAPGSVAAEVAQPMEAPTEPVCAASAVMEEIQPTVTNDLVTQDFEMPSSAIQIQEEAVSPEPQQVPEQEVFVEQHAPKVEQKREPVFGPLILRMGNHIRSGAGRSSAGLRRGALHLARGSQTAAGKAIQGLRMFLAIVQQQGIARCSDVSRVAAGANRKFVESYSAAYLWWQSQRETRKSKKTVRVEDALTASSARSARSITQPAAPIRLSSKHSSRERDWELAVVGAAIASCLIVIVFGITSRPTKAAAASPSHVAISDSAIAPAAPVPAAVEKSAAQTKPQSAVTAHRNSRHAQASSSDEYSDDVVVRHYDAQTHHGAAEKTSGVKYYSDEQ